MSRRGGGFLRLGIVNSLVQMNAWHRIYTLSSVSSRVTPDLTMGHGALLNLSDPQSLPL